MKLHANSHNMTLKPIKALGVLLIFGTAILSPTTAFAANITGTNGNDQLVGTPSDDVLSGKKGNDVLEGLEGDDFLYGNGGKDTLFGGDGSDTLYGGGGRDVLNGEAGDDMLVGGNGKDRLIWDGGWDNMSGGRQADIFEFKRPTTTDRVIVVINDFVVGEDHIDITAYDVLGNKYDIHKTGSRGNTYMFLHDGNGHVVSPSIQLTGVDANDLTPDNFIIQ